MLSPTSYSYFPGSFLVGADFSFMSGSRWDFVRIEWKNGRERSMRVEQRAEPRSEIRSLVCHPADVLPLRWEREGEGTRVSMYVCVCMRISREKTIKGL